MTIEQEFYKVFGIEPMPYSKCTSDYCISAEKPYPTICKKCPYYTVYKIEYPPITDRILLELICILSKTGSLEFNGVCSVEEIKEELLKTLIECEKDTGKIKHKVQQLFKEYE